MAYTYTVTVPCRTISPWFMYGALKNSFEVRPSEFIYGMRQWIRRFNSGATPSDVFALESQIFGKGGENLSAAEVSVDVDLFTSLRLDAPTGGKRTNFFEQEMSGRPTYNRHEREYKGDEFGVAYLFYTKNLGDNCNDQYALPGYEVDNNPDANDFQIVFRSDYIERLEIAISSLIALSIFSGVGSRTRRGAGCFEIDFGSITTQGCSVQQFTIAENGWSTFILSPDNQDIRVLKNAISKIIARLYASIGKCRLPNPGQRWYKNSIYTLFGNDYEGWFDCLNDVGTTLALHRLNLDPRENVMFGLPNKKFKVRGDSNYRRASPLMITVVCLGDHLIPLLYELDEIFILNDVQITSNRETIIPEFDAIHNFLNANFDALV